MEKLILKCNLSEDQKNKEFEWVNWNIIDKFKYETRDYIMIQKWNISKGAHDRFICYRSQSGMLWHMLFIEYGLEYGSRYMKFDNCGLYTTSFLLDLNLQKEFCKQNNFTEINDFDFDKKVESTTGESIITAINDKDLFSLTPTADSDDSYSETLQKHGLSCVTGQYLIFSNSQSFFIPNQLKDKNVPNCGRLYNGQNRTEVEVEGSKKKKSKELYLYFRSQINEIMNEKFKDLSNEKKLYSCSSGKIGIIYNGYKFVKTEYTIFRREIQPHIYKGTGRNKFILIYAKYKFIENEEDNITLPSEKFKDKQFIIPLFITSQDNKQKNYPLINKVAAAGLYSCKAFEYKKQTFGEYDYGLNNLSAHEKEKSDANLELPGSGIYYFVGEFMDKMWPFEGWGEKLD